MPNSVFKEEPAKSKGRDNLFLWTVFLLLLAALVFACWLGSFYIFGHPEQPRAYRVLQKLGKLAPPARFVVTKAPPGEFLEAQRVFERYSKYTALQMQRENELLFRCYLKNYTETKKAVPYLTGKFVILRAYELQRGDLINSGVVVLTQAVDFPQMLAEIVYPAPKERVSDVLALLQPGLELHLQRTLDLSAIVQVSHAPDGRLQVSVFPLLYGSYALKNGVGSFSLEPPGSLNVAAGFPLVRGEEVRSVMRESFRRKAVVKGAQPDSQEHSGEIIRLEAPPLSGPSNPASALASNAEMARPAQKTMGNEASGPLSPVISSRAGPAEEQKTASTTDGAPGQIKDGKMAVPGSGGAQGREADSRAEGGGKAEAVKNGNPAWMARVVPNSGATSPTGTATVVARTEMKSGSLAATVDSQAARNGKGNAAQAGSASSKAPPVLQVASTVSSQPAVADPPKGTPKQGALSGGTVPSSSSAGASAGAGPPGSAGGTGGGKPFLAASPAPSTTQPTGTWKTYSGGKSPSGKSVTTEQATSLQGRNDGAPVYLHGRFTVTAVGTNRAVLRQAGGGEGKGQPRVIVEYPAGAVPPQQGGAVAREEGRGFEIREVRRTPDGQVNIFVREVSSP